MRIKLILFTLSFIYSNIINAQNVNNFWSLNTGKMLDFNQIPAELVDLGNPVAFTTGMSTTLSDSLGKLLFYSNGTIVFDSTHQIMLDGRIHLANNYSRMPAIIIPKDFKEKEYYLFTLFSGPGFINYERSELFYTVVDLKLNNGLGGIQTINDQKNIFIQNDLSGKMIAARGVCGSVWLITHGINNNTFFSYKIDEKGINLPVVSEIGTIHTDNQGFEEEGFMTFSSDFENILICGGRDNFAEILDFDVATGRFTNPRNIPIEENTIITTGGSFSKHKSKIYVLEKESETIGHIYQIDFENNNDISNKQFLIDVASNPSQNLQLGPDEVIYVREGEGAISGIYNADDAIENVLFRDSVFFADSRVATFSALHNPIVFPILPSQTDSLLLPQDTQLCQNTQLTLQVQAEGDRYLWQDGSTTKDYEITAPGTYWVEVQKGNCTFTDTLEIFPDDTFVDIGTDTTICAGESLLLAATSNNDQYRWQDGSTNPDFTVTEDGLYWVESSDSLCSHRDSIEVKVTGLAVNLPPDTTICPGQNLFLSFAQTGIQYEWQDGSTQPLFSITDEGLYWVEAQKGECTIRDSINVSYAEQRSFLSNDTTICDKDSFLITPPPFFEEIVWWGNPLAGDSIFVNETGIYHAIILDENCAWLDSIEVTFEQSPILELGQDTTLCDNESLTLTIPTENVTYEWQDGSQVQNFEVTESGTYWVKIMQDNCIAQDTIQVTFAPQPMLSLGNDTTLCINSTLTLTAPNILNNYQWQDGTSNPTQLITETGDYWLEGKIGNCFVEGEIQVTFEDCEPPQLCQAYLPNSFSPNGDGINDNLQLLTDCELQFFQMEVYDRWGNLLFSTNDVWQAWDGRYEGDLLDTGVYLWVVEYQFMEQVAPILKTETITLLK